jgi:microfibrillar-associated protein 1
LERRRRMSEAERDEEDRALGLGKYKKTKEKAKWNFLQRYYHKGVFYMDSDTVKDDDDVRLREYSEPTLEDKWDKEKLPAVLQVKKFGKRGRTKYTHLTDQDTTDFTQGRVRIMTSVQEKYMSMRSGVGDIDTAGRRKKQKPV